MNLVTLFLLFKPIFFFFFLGLEDSASEGLIAKVMCCIGWIRFTGNQLVYTVNCTEAEKNPFISPAVNLNPTYV